MIATNILRLLTLPMAAQLCIAAGLAMKDDPRTGLTLSGSEPAITALLRATSNSPHRWSARKGPTKPEGAQTIRVEWPGGPGPADVGSIVHLTQLAKQNGLTISDTLIVATP